LATVLPIIYGIKRIAEGGNAWLAALGGCVGVLCGIVFVLRQLTLPDPLLDLRLFKEPALTVSLTINPSISW
jgi:MFS transporter, DHA2 family, multidrug resistance protein